MRNYYQILGVCFSASQKEIAAAYRAKCKLLHPDVNPSAVATSQMQVVNEAYHILSNTSLRREYDEQYRCFFAIGKKVYPESYENNIETPDHESKKKKTWQRRTSCNWYSNHRNDKGYLSLKKGSIIGTTVHGHQCKIVELFPECISVQLVSPIPLSSSSEMSYIYRCMDKTPYAIKKDGDYYTTEIGFKEAQSLLIELSEKEDFFYTHLYRLAELIKEYRKKVNDKSELFYKTLILIDLQREFFPEIKKTILTVDVVDNLYNTLQRDGIYNM